LAGWGRLVTRIAAVRLEEGDVISRCSEVFGVA